MNWAKRQCLILVMLVVPTAVLRGEDLKSQYWPVLSQQQVEGIMEAVSGETARDHVRYITQHWRWAPSQGFRQVGEYMVARAKEYGLKDARIERFLADRNTRYLGATMHRPFWDPRAAELWVIEPVRRKITSFADIPISVAGYSRTSDVKAELVDVGVGISAEDYAGKDVRGKIVLGTGAVGLLQRMAVFERGAAGVLSAWTPEFQTSRDPLDYPDQVTWGTGVVPESATGQPSTFAFMLSRRQRQTLLDLLKGGKKVTLHATVEADFEEPGYLEVVNAVIPGTDPAAQELVFTAHLEHPKPAANDNASGSAAILEVARVLQSMIASGQLPPPKRTIRFLWVQEGRSTRAYLEKHPEAVEKTFAVINMDIVGNDQEKTKAILYFWQASASRPTFVSDVVEDFFELVRNTNNDRMPTEPLHPIVAPTGNRRPFIGEVERYRRPSDQTYMIAYGIPGVNFAAWPDQFHHTPFDTPDKVDPTQLERVAFIAAASAAALATADSKDAYGIIANLVGRAQARLGEDLTKGLRLLERANNQQLTEAYKEARNVVHQGHLREALNLDSVRLLAGSDKAVLDYLAQQKTALAAGEPSSMQHLWLYYKQRGGTGTAAQAPLLTAAESQADKRIPSWAGAKIDAEGLVHQLEEAHIARPRIFRYTWSPISGTLLTPFNVVLSETLCFIDGKRSIKEIRDAVSGQYDPVPLDVVEELFQVLEKTKIVKIQSR